MAAGSLWALLSLCACRVPLLNLLGYESSLALNLAVAPMAVAVGYAAFVPGQTTLAAFATAWRRVALALLPSLAVLAGNGLWVKNCSYAAGLAFFAALPLASGVYGASLGVALAALRLGPALPLVAATALGPLAVALGRLYALPPIAAYDHLWGYFAGSIYDETVQLDGRFAWFRAATAGRVLLAVLLVAWLGAKARPKAWRLLAALGLVALAWAVDATLGARLGYAVDRAQLRRVLPQLASAPGLVLHLPAELDKAQALRLLRDHGFRLAQVQRRLGLAAAGPPIHSWVFANANQKAYWTGGRGTMVAKAWLHEIYLHGTESPHPLVAHELVHAAVAQLGRPPWAGPWHGPFLPNVGLIEGLAEAVAFRDRDEDLATTAACLWPTGTAARLEAAMGGKLAPGAPPFWAQPGPRAYAESGAFVAHLLARYGPEAVAKAYRAGDFLAAFGRPLAALVADFGQTLSAALPPTDRCRRVRDSFAGESIFSRTCAHELARLRQAQRGASAARAVQLQRQVQAHLPGSTQERLLLATRLLDQGGAAAEAEAQRIIQALAPANVYLAAEVHGALAATYARRQDLGQASQELEAGLALGLGGAQERSFCVYRWSLGLPPEDQAHLAAFLRGEANPWTIASLLAGPPLAGDKTARYLLGRQLLLQGEAARGTALLQAAGPHPAPAIETERLRLLVQRAWQRSAGGEPLTAAQQAVRTAALAAMAAEKDATRAARWAQDMEARLAWEAALD